MYILVGETYLTEKQVIEEIIFSRNLINKLKEKFLKSKPPQPNCEELKDKFSYKTTKSVFDIIMSLHSWRDEHIIGGIYNSLRF